MLNVSGFEIRKGYLAPPDQARILGEIRAVEANAPPFAMTTPSGRRMSVRMTSAGKYGWFSDKKGYRYVERHPSGAPWPPIPDSVLAIWRDLVGRERLPDCCLVNLYDEKSRLGMHRDADERDFAWPVLSISLGDPGVFRMGGPKRSDPTRSVLLESGDVVVMGGAARLAHHGIDRIRFGTSKLLPEGGRINLTLRVVD